MDGLDGAIDSLRLHVPTMDAGWLAAQTDEMREDPANAHIYAAADAAAEDVAEVLAVMAREATRSLPDGLDPDDLDGLRWAAAQGKSTPALAFVLECFEAAATFRVWGNEGDFGPALDRVALRAREWLTPMTDAERHALKSALSKANAEAASLELKQRSQQRGNTIRASKAKDRKRAAWAVFGLDGPHGPSLLARIANNEKASAGQIEKLAVVYGCADANEFMKDAMDKRSALRKRLKNDNQQN